MNCDETPPIRPLIIQEKLNAKDNCTMCLEMLISKTLVQHFLCQVRISTQNMMKIRIKQALLYSQFNLLQILASIGPLPYLDVHMSTNQSHVSLVPGSALVPVQLYKIQVDKQTNNISCMLLHACPKSYFQNLKIMVI